MDAVPSPAPPAFRFGRFSLDPVRRVLLEDGVPSKLGPRATDLLLELVQHRDRVVSKSELFDRVWAGLVVEENNLQQHISALRKLLGPRAIVTVPGRGYQFTERLDDARPEAPSSGPPSLEPLAQPLAVPPDPGTLFGRDTDLGELSARLQQHTLVTLVGPGGIGKTRLAWAAARAEPGRWSGGVAWVDLSALDAGPRVPAAVAQVLDIVLPDRAARDASAAVASALRGRELLLLLDNCEHVLDAVSLLVEALHRLAPQVHVLATSQEPMRVAREQVIRLQTLADPAAVRLFVARATAADRRFVADASAQAPMVEICHRLGGIPLAIELAAARVPLLGLSGLRRRLDEGLRVLASGPARAPARQRTLHAALSWSHGLLDPAEQDLFRRIAVFSGGFSPELAQRVLGELGSSPNADAWDLLDRLGALVDKSLLIADTEPVPRCRLLEPVRQYALERLHDSAEAPALRLRHARAMVELLRDFDRAVTHEPAYDLALRPVLVEVDNLRAAMQWLTATGSGTTPSAFDASLSPPEARRLAIELAAHADWLSVDADGDGEIFRFCELSHGWLDEHTPAALKCRMLLSYHSQARARSLPAAVRLADVRASIAGCRTVGDRPSLYRALCMLGRSPQSQVSHEEAGAALAEAQAIEDPQWSPRLRMRLQVGLEWWYDLGGRLEDSVLAGRRCLALAREAGSMRSVIAALGNVADTEFALGRVDEAIALCREAIALAKSHALPAAARHVYSNMVPALLARDQLDAAADAIREGRRLMVRSHGSARDLLLPAALLAWRRGESIGAARLLGCADRVYRELGDEPHPPERRMRDTVLAGLQAALSAATLDSLLSDGACFNEDEGFAHAGMG
jgi:predicted ATPase/DNA-binding winged helix-turn-helix (wHTH) protein/tetratricopeptide (TPR) repeat protein